jgi:acyl-coenzyme A synthetase/AMP-(fatty) acid ligase
VGVNADEMVPVYGTWCPEIAAIFFALNAIGAHPYFEKLDITENALRTETAGAKVGVVFEPLWNEVVKAVFGEERFKTIFIIRLTDSMKYPLKLIAGLMNKKHNGVLQDNKKYIYKPQVKELAKQYKGIIEEPFKKDRIALITSSSGTTSSLVTGIMDTNEGALGNILTATASELGFFAGKDCLITLPPTASTAINCFFLLPLLNGI